MTKKKKEQIKTLDILWKNTLNLIGAAKLLLTSDQKVSYAFVLLQICSEEMGRIYALYLYFTEHKSVEKPPKDNHIDKHVYFTKFMSFQPVGRRSYFEIMSAITGFNITKTNINKMKTLQKIQNYKEMNLYVTIRSAEHRATAQPLKMGLSKKKKLIVELLELQEIYMHSMLYKLIRQYENKS